MSRRAGILLITAAWAAVAVLTVLQVLFPPVLHFMSRWAVALAWAGGFWLGWQFRAMRKRGR